MKFKAGSKHARAGGGEVEGAEELMELLNALGEAAAMKALQRATNYAMTPVLKSAIKNAPESEQAHNFYINGRKAEPFLVPPGWLKSSIIKRKVPARVLRHYGKVATAVFIADRAWYGWFVEAGTSRQPGQHFMRKAWESNEAEVKDRFTKKLFQDVKRTFPGITFKGSY